MQDFDWNLLFLAITASAALVTAVLNYSSFRDFARRWRKDHRIRSLEERLRYAYGPLHSIIHQKFTNPTSEDSQWLLKSKGEEERVHEIFRAFPYLIEERTWEEWNRIFSPRTAFGEVYVGLERTEKGLLIGGVPKMQEWLKMIESEYDALVREHRQLMN